jgi:rSAM/selenodomain-associated transferase 1
VTAGRSAATILLFAKEPLAGTVKTRLVPALTPEEAADLAAAFLRDLHATLLGVPGAEVVVALTDESSAEAVERLLGPGVRFARQGEGDLGERLARATGAAFARGRGPVAVVGSDHPDLPGELVAQCLEDARNGRIGWIPTEDGGYAALALPRPLPSLFEGIPWSTTKVEAATRARAAELGIALKNRGRWYDVDRIEDLARLSGVLGSGSGCPATREALARLDPPLAARSRP